MAKATSKSLAIPTTPSSILSDALSVFTKSANNALSAVEDQFKSEIARVKGEANETRRERDEAIQALHAARLDEKERDRRFDGWKTSLEKSDLTIQHQSETIVQLREEAQQWKNQLLRFEETSRREIQDWKEQYIRAEQERSRLSARIDELVAEQLMMNGHANTQFPRSQKPPSVRSNPANFDDILPSPRKSQKSKPVEKERARTEIEQRPPPRNTGRTPKKQPAASSSTVPPKSPAPTRPQSAPRPSVSVRELQSMAPAAPRVIRRVQAVVEIPVKEEEYEDEDGFLSDAQSVRSTYEPPPKKASSKTQSKQTQARRRSSTAKGKKIIESDEDEYEEDEDDLVDVRIPVRKSQSRKRVVPEEESSEEDELILGGEDNREDLYGEQRVVAGIGTHKRTTATRPATAKKRKLDGNSAARSTSSKARGVR
ncbi:hypothetical protein C8Q75DRAFT_891770 [Abortiporus biennis]|nr:hypothetical protein C8Q75DRAFT_891770 [Abortiporus biennis]